VRRARSRAVRVDKEGQQAFWSYVHKDDDDESGRITKLAAILAARLRLLTGEDFPIFCDKEVLAWGEDWAMKIDEALLSTTFFIPIVTPSYFSSESCRDELLRFSSSAKALGLEELILPIYYVDVADLNSPGPSGDELVELVRRYHWEDWRQTALEESESSVYRKAVHDLATKLLARAAQADEKPTEVSTQTRSAADARRVRRAARKATGNHLAEDEEEEPAEEDESDEAATAPEELEDRLSVLAEGESALPRLQQRLEHVPPIMEQMSTDAIEATEAMHQSDARGKGFCGATRGCAGVRAEAQPSRRSTRTRDGWIRRRANSCQLDGHSRIPRLARGPDTDTRDGGVPK
jgi:TIR domain